jgi:ribose transport system permease protein
MNKVKQNFKRCSSLLVLIILSGALVLFVPNFLTINNLINIIRQAAVNGIISAGMLVVLITGGIDLSVGGNAILCACIMGAFLNKLNINSLVVLVMVCIATGLIVGLINGLLFTKLHLPHPFVSTLGMKNVVCGLAMLVVSTKTISGFPKAITWLGEETFYLKEGVPGIPVSFVVLIVIYILIDIMLRYTSLGKKIFCIGGNIETARLSGINTDNVLIFVYSFSGLMCAIAGIVIIGRSGVANPSSAFFSYDTDAIAACIIGGASFSGGKGNIWGTLIGVFVITIIRNGLTLLNIASELQYIVIGIVIIAVVFWDVIRKNDYQKSV